MSLSSGHPIKRLADDLQPGMPVGSRWLADRGISAQLAYGYVKRGWLESLAKGVFAKPGTALDRDPSLRFLAEAGYHVHVGGKTALAWQGFQHNLALGGELLTLFRSHGRGLPSWFTTRFRCRVSSRRLFEETSAGLSYVTSAHPRHPGVPMSDPERATLEMLSEIPHWQSMEEAEQLMEGLVSLRRDVMHDLLKRCVNVKTVRLFLRFARQFDLPVLEGLPVSELRTGSTSRYVRKTPRGTLVLKS